jgi:hypothetical protein
MNQLRAGVAELLTGNSIQTQEQLRKHSSERLLDDLYPKRLRQILDFYRKFTVANEQWDQLVLAMHNAGEDLVDTRAMREKYLHFNATGLVILGRVGHHIFKQPEDDQDRLITALAQIDWRRSSPLWRGNVIQGDGRLVTQNAPVSTAVAKVKQLIGLPLQEYDEKRLAVDQSVLELS